MGHVQDTPVSAKMILNECMIYHMKVNIVSYNLGPKKWGTNGLKNGYSGSGGAPHYYLPTLYDLTECVS